jgi:cell division septum initiation protein DivIVA
MAAIGAFTGALAVAQVAPPASPTDQNSQQAAGSPYQGYPSGYPAPEVQAVPMAFAHAVASRAEQDQMLNELHAAVDRIREDFNYSPEMIAATREQNGAFDAYDQARRNVLEKLSTDPTYRAMISLVVTLKQKLEDERPGKRPSEGELERLLATATLKLSYASAASAMEVASLSADADVMQTHARLIEAADKVGVMRADFEREIHRNPEFLAARRNLDEARINRLTADAFLSGAVDARDVALNYAYYLRQYSYTPAAYGSNLYPFSYGYGYGYGNGIVNGGYHRN